jgi:hypothetical protein
MKEGDKIQFTEVAPDGRTDKRTGYIQSITGDHCRVRWSGPGGGKPYESCEYVSAMEKIKVEAGEC